MHQTFSKRALMAGALATIGLWALGTPRLLAQAQDPAARHIETYYASLLPTVQQTAGLSVAERARRISGSISNAFDLATMTRLAIGSEWSRFSGAQQAAVRDAFGKFVVANYASQMSGYTGQAYKVEPVSETRGNDRVVKTSIGSSQINYLVRGGRIIDVYFNGTVSDMATRRAEFSSILSSGGPDGLIKELHARTQKLLAG